MNKLIIKYHPDRYPSNDKYLKIQEAFDELKKDPKIYSKEYFETLKGIHELEIQVNIIFINLSIPFNFSNRYLFYQTLKSSNIEIRQLISLIKEREAQLNKIITPSIFSSLIIKEKKEKKIKPFFCNSCKRSYNLEKRLKEHMNSNKHKERSINLYN